MCIVSPEHYGLELLANPALGICSHSSTLLRTGSNSSKQLTSEITKITAKVRPVAHTPASPSKHPRKLMRKPHMKPRTKPTSERMMTHPLHLWRGTAVLDTSAHFECETLLTKLRISWWMAIKLKLHDLHSVFTCQMQHCFYMFLLY